MDRKSIIILLASFILLLVWFPLMNQLYPPIPLPVDTNAPPGRATSVATNRLEPVPSEAATIKELPTAGVTTTQFIRPEATEELITLENEDARYTFTSHGGGLKLVELKHFPESVRRSAKPTGASNQVATLNGRASIPIMALFGQPALQGDGLFQLSRTNNGVQAIKTYASGLRLIKEFLLGTNYVITARVRWENPAADPARLPAQEWVIGTATPLGTNALDPLMGFYWYDGVTDTHIDEPWFANMTMGCIPGTPRTEYNVENAKIVWAAVHNQFFAMVAKPKEPAARLKVRHVDLVAPEGLSSKANVKAGAKIFGYQASFVYPEVVLKPGETVQQEYHIFAGPKEYKTLTRLGSDQYLVMGFSGFFGWFAQALLWSMNSLNSMGMSYAIAIIAITVIIKLLFWPLTHAGTKSMKRMAALQPQMKAIQEKYKEDPKKMNLKLMEFMKEHKVSPLGGCLPMLLQLPVFFGFYRMLQTAIELRGERFLWVWDLSQPDTIGYIPGFGFPVNPLPLLMGGTMLWQARLTPASPGMDPVQQKIMKYMPLMFMVFLYNFSAGLTLYWTVQNLLTIAQMKLTKSGNEPPAGPPKASVAPARPMFLPKKKK